MTLFCIKTWYRCAIVISLLTDILALTQGSIDGNYFVGTKFAVVYQHLFLLTLFMMDNSSSLMKKNSLNNYRVRFTFYALLILTIILSLYVDCMTGVIGTALFFVFSLLVRYNSKMMASGGMFIGAVLASFAFMWVVPSILLNENVASFITNKLNRSLSLTGRTLIFERIPQIMQGKWLLGFGYGSSYEICRRYIGFADTQNALMEWIMQIGVLGSVLLCLMLCYCITRLNKNIMIYTEWVWPLAFVYTYVALGTIEITYSYAEWEKAKKEVEQESYIVQPYISGPRIVVEIVRQDTRNEVYEMLSEQGITARKYFYPLTNSFECYRNYPTAGVEKTPVAQHLALRVLTLPLYADLALEDVDRICDIILA